MSNSRMNAWAIWTIASVFFGYQYILRVMPNIMLDDIMQQFQISAATFGQFSGVYYIGYSLMHLPIGIMLDRFGAKKILSGCILLTVAGLLPLIFANHWIYPILGRALIGMGSSAAILGIFKIVRMAFSKERYTCMLSLSIAIGLIGAIYGGGPVSYMREVFGYQSVIQFFAINGVILAIATYWIIPNIEASQETSVISNIKEVLSNQRVIFSCLFAGLMIGPLEGFADVWGTAFLKQVYGFDSTLSASWPSMIFIGTCIGGPILVFIAEKIGNYLAVIVGAGMGMTATFYFFLNSSFGSGAISLSFIFIGICCGYQLLAIYKATTYVREEVAGLTTAIANMIIMTFGYAFHTIIGGVVNSLGGPSSSDALIYGVAVIPVGLTIGTFGFTFLLMTEKKLPKVATKQSMVFSK